MKQRPLLLILPYFSFSNVLLAAPPSFFQTKGYVRSGQKITADDFNKLLPAFVAASSIIPFGPASQTKTACTITLNNFSSAVTSFHLHGVKESNYNAEIRAGAAVAITFNEATRTITADG
ncbi:MAG: hypothetical protein V4717_24195 [Bacteroidota bacterium]